MIYKGHNGMREFGTALAVVGIYILTLLLPLHSAAGLQRNLASLGYETIGKVSICNPARPTNATPDTNLVDNCAAAGIAKTPFSDATALTQLHLPPASSPAPEAWLRSAPPAAKPLGKKHARAPPRQA